MTYKDIDVEDIIGIAQRAGDAIMEIYARDFSVETKEDSSPLTEADKKSNTVILEGLKHLYPEIPFISEETKQIPFEERKHWKRFWLIDPIDGTKEFIKKNGEFTVNIALVEEDVPVVGVVHVPARDETYFAGRGLGAFKRQNINDKQQTKIHSDGHYSSKEKVVVVGSRSHLSPETLEFVEELKARGKEVEFRSSGSSLKLCLVASGEADVYPRFGPTMEWDTGAAHAIALYAGRSVINYDTKQPLVYNKENLLNPWFIVE